jgi:hypothetical protein
LPILFAMLGGFVACLYLLRRNTPSAEGSQWETKYRELLQRYRDLTQRLKSIEQETECKSGRLRQRLVRVEQILRGDPAAPNADRVVDALREVNTALDESRYA